MNVITELLRGRGRRRAVDRIPVLEAELAAANWLVAKFREDLTHADALITSACRQRDSAIARNTRLVGDLEGLRIAHDATLDAYDELAARYAEITGEPANPDAEPTEELHIPAAWLAA